MKRPTFAATIHTTKLSIMTLSLILSLGCKELSHVAIEGSDTSTDIDSDTYSDTDSDTDPDPDSDPDSDSDGDSDGDTDTEADSDSDSDTQDSDDALVASIETPSQGYIEEESAAITFKGTVGSALFQEEELIVEWVSSLDGQVGMSSPDSEGNVTLISNTLTPGWHSIALRVTNPNGQSISTSIFVGICVWAEPETFDLDLEGSAWGIYGDAYWSKEGWLEMTGKQQGKEGQIFNLEATVPPDAVKLSFDLRTGGGLNGGADGFAMSIIDAEDANQLELIIADMFHGGGLGYAYNAKPDTWDVRAFHIEFDTWYNETIWNQNHGDPTNQNHIAVHLNGNPRDPVLWLAKDIEDCEWHNMTVDIQDEHVLLTLDGETVIDETVPGLDFRGGFIGFSGSTGEATNLHSFDNLHFLDQCVVP